MTGLRNLRTTAANLLGRILALVCLVVLIITGAPAVTAQVGGGLILTTRWTDPLNIAGPSEDLELKCVDRSGHTITTKFRTGKDGTNSYFRFSAAEAPLGARCQFNAITEGSVDSWNSSRQSIDYLWVGNRFELVRSGEVFESRTEFDIDNPQGERVNRTVEYQYATQKLEILKAVGFDQSTRDYVPGKQEKIDRAYSFEVLCIDLSGRRTRYRTSATAAESAIIENVPIGSHCTVAEVDLPQEPGVGLHVEGFLREFSNAGLMPDPSVQGESPRNVYVDPAEGGSVDFLNQYSRLTSAITVEARLTAVGPTALQAAQVNQRTRVHLSLNCQDPSDDTVPNFQRPAMLELSRAAQGAPMTTTFTGVPVGMDCTVSTYAWPVEFDFTATLPQGDFNGLAKIEATTTWTVGDDDDEEAIITPDLAGSAQTNRSPKLRVSETAAENKVTMLHNYGYATSKMQLEKWVTMASGDEATLRAMGPEKFTFSYVCFGPDFHYSNAGNDGTGPTDEVTWDDLELAYEIQGRKMLHFTSAPSEMDFPIGTWCEVKEDPIQPVPGMSMNVNSPNGLLLEITEAGNLPESFDGSTPQMTRASFTNTFQRKLIPIGVMFAAAGSAVPANPTYTFDYVCREEGNPQPVATGTFTSEAVGRNVTINNSHAEMTDASGQDVPVQRAFSAPAGSVCTITERTNSVPESPELKETGVPTRDRRPYTMLLGKDVYGSFGLVVDGEEPQWGTGVMVSKREFGDFNGTGVELYPGQQGITDQAAFKARTMVFQVPMHLPEGMEDMVGYTILAQHLYIKDSRPVYLRKEANLPAGAEGTTFAFSYTCDTGESGTVENVRAGQRVRLAELPVGARCGVTETRNEAAGMRPLIDWEVPELTLVGDLSPQGATASFEVWPTPFLNFDASDPDLSTITVRNSYPAIQLTKTIAGTLVGADGSSILDTAILEPGQPAMEVTYRVTNPGGPYLRGAAVRDPSLAGPNYRVFTLGGQPVTVGPDGTFSGHACRRDVGTHQSFSCTLRVEFTADADQPIVYRGEATVTAQYNDGSVSDTDAFGAIRPPRLAFLLPNTGTTTMVWVLGIGLAVLAFALIRYLRAGRHEQP